MSGVFRCGQCRWLQSSLRVFPAELFIAGELLSAGGRAVLEVMLHEAAHALATQRGIKATSAQGNRYHNKRFAALAAELGLRGPDVPDKITGWSDCTLTGQAAYDGYADVAAGIDSARLPFLADLTSPARPGDGGEDQGDDGPGKPTKRGGRWVAVECACQPEPRRIQLTPKQIEDGPIVCGLCCAPFEPPEHDAEPAPDYQEQGPSLSGHSALVRSTGSVEPEIVD